MSDTYRHELKYYINSGDYILLSTKLRATMRSDDYAELSGGEYFIRSLYFDDMDDSAFREKLNGADNRDKFRIRTYNLDKNAIKLECKHKEGGYILKQSIMLSYDEYVSIMRRNYLFLLRREESFAHRMYTEFSSRNLTPRVIVDYTREPYVFPYNDVRVTFDKYVCTAHRATDMFNAELPTYPVTDGRGTVLEIKFAETLPTYVRSLIQTDAHTRSAISKYCLCRKFEI